MTLNRKVRPVPAEATMPMPCSAAKAVETLDFANPVLAVRSGADIWPPCRNNSRSSRTFASVPRILVSG